MNYNHCALKRLANGITRMGVPRPNLLFSLVVWPNMGGANRVPSKNKLGACADTSVLDVKV